MNTIRTYIVPSDVVSRQVGDETVILHLESGTYFGLNPIGAKLWNLIGAGEPMDAICAALLEEYDIQQDVLRRDLDDLVQALLDRQLLSIA